MLFSFVEMQDNLQKVKILKKSDIIQAILGAGADMEVQKMDFQ